MIRRREGPCPKAGRRQYNRLRCWLGENTQCLCARCSRQHTRADCSMGHRWRARTTFKFRVQRRQSGDLLPQLHDLVTAFIDAIFHRAVGMRVGKRRWDSKGHRRSNALTTHRTVCKGLPPASPAAGLHAMTLPASRVPSRARPTGPTEVQADPSDPTQASRRLGSRAAGRPGAVQVHCKEILLLVVVLTRGRRAVSRVQYGITRVSAISLISFLLPT